MGSKMRINILWLVNFSKPILPKCVRVRSGVRTQVRREKEMGLYMNKSTFLKLIEYCTNWSAQNNDLDTHDCPNLYSISNLYRSRDENEQASQFLTRHTQKF